MDPITIALIGMSAIGKLGGLMGKKRKAINPEELKQLFGAKAVTNEQMELFNRAISSAQGQKLMAGAAQAGQNFQTDVARSAAGAGLGGGEGMTSGADIFGNAAGAQATGNLQRNMQGDIMASMLPIAQQLVSDRMQAWLADRNAALGQTTRFQDIMSSIGGLGGDLLAARAASGAGGNQTGDTKPVNGPNWESGPDYEGYKDFKPQPMGAAPPGVNANAPAGAAAVVPQAGARQMSPMGAMPQLAGAPVADPMAMNAARRRMLQFGGGGRFARAMTSNRFGAVQRPAYAL